jgi:hypothetical protein
LAAHSFNRFGSERHSFLQFIDAVRQARVVPAYTIL